MILALDPGKTTGFALKAPAKPIEVGEWDYDEVWNNLRSIQPNTIVCETFSHRMVGNVDYSPAELIGVIKLYATMMNVEIVWQMPAQAKHYWTNDRLKEKGLYVAGRPHAMDALRHYLYFTGFSKGERT